MVGGDELGALASSFNEMQLGLRELAELRVEREQLLDEVLASRARIVSASDAERRRVERNLHDGAQQRLVALALNSRCSRTEPLPTQPRTWQASRRPSWLIAGGATRARAGPPPRRC